MIRISATNLEAFRRFKADTEMDVADFLAYLRRETPPTPAMLAGTAFHKVLEHAGECELSMVEQDGYRFEFRLDAEINLPTLREIKLERHVLIDGEPVTLVGVVDAMHARTVYDHKLTARTDAESYTDSLQWRCYLDWFDADCFVYNLFEKYAPEREPDLIIIKSFTPITFYRYPGMAEDVMREVRDFIEFCRWNADWMFQRKAA